MLAPLAAERQVVGQPPSLRGARSTIGIMSIKEVAAAALKLVPRDRARLAGKLLESLEDLSEEENELIWNQEAERRDAAWNSRDSGRTAKRVLRNARAKLR
jgi:hypothetical protein